MHTSGGLHRSNSVTPTALSLRAFVFSFRPLCLRERARAPRPFAATIPLPPTAEAGAHSRTRARDFAPPLVDDPSASESARRAAAAVDLHLRRCNGLARWERKSHCYRSCAAGSIKFEARREAHSAWMRARAREVLNLNRPPLLSRERLNTGTNI